MNCDSITSLINKYKHEYDKLYGEGERDIFGTFYNSINKEHIQKWLNKYVPHIEIKCNEKANILRKEGNNYYNREKFQDALQLYTRSLCYAHYNSEEFLLSLGNRSAALYKLRKYESSARDLEMCLKLSTSQGLSPKLYTRLYNCYMHLNVPEKAENLLLSIKNDCSLTEKVVMLTNQTEQMKLKINHDNTENIQFTLPELCDGENKNFVGASNAVTLNYNEDAGRHVIANRNLKMGDVIFVEKAYTFVPVMAELNSEYTENCSSCLKYNLCSIPCRNCTMLYCGVKCRDHDWEHCHQWECLGWRAQLWSYIGVSHLGFHIFLTAASTEPHIIMNTSTQPKLRSRQYERMQNDYSFVSELITNIEKMNKDDVFPHVLMSALLTLYLKERTNFFDYLKNSISDSDEAELFRNVGGLILKHTLQVVTNASIIESPSIDFYNEFNTNKNIYNSGLQVIGAGLYPSVSMMNHSCETNITNYFHEDIIVVKAKRDIFSGEEICNSYGYESCSQSTCYRQEHLMKQYFFTCKCAACSSIPTKPEMYEEGLLCQKCTGCSIKCNEELYKCTMCNHAFSPLNHFTYMKKADILNSKYEKTKNIDYLKKCLSLREKVFYKYNKTIYYTNLELQTFYEEQEDYTRWWECALISVDLEQLLLSKNSLGWALNQRNRLLTAVKYLNILKNDKSQLSNFNSVVALVTQWFNEIQCVFKLYYSEHKISYADLSEILQKIVNKEK